MTIDRFIIIWFLLLIPYGIYWYSKYLSDQDKTESMMKYLKTDLDNYGLKVLKIEKFEPKKAATIFSKEDCDFIISPGHWPISHVYSVYKKLFLEDSKGRQYEVSVSIDFKSFHNRRVKRLRWKPNLETIKST